MIEIEGHQFRVKNLSLIGNFRKSNNMKFTYL